MQRAGIIVDRQKARACAVAVADWPHQPLAYGLMFERRLCNGAVNRIHSHAALVRIDNRSEVLGRLRSCDGAVGRIHSPSGAVAQSGAVGRRTGAVVRIHNCSGVPAHNYSRCGAVGRIRSHAALVYIHNVRKAVGRIGSHPAQARIHNRNGDLVRIHTGVLVRVRIHSGGVNRSRLPHGIHSHNRVLRARLLD